MNYAEMARSLGGQFYAQAIALAPKILSGLLIFFAFWLAGRIVKALIERSGRRTRISHEIVGLLGRTVQIICIIFGAVTALGTIGVDVGALIAGLGLSSFALGFAFKDALSNFLAGIFILLYKPFRIGNQITITGLEGKVIDIDLRYTTLDTAEKRILIPNSSIFVNPIVIARPSAPVRSGV